MCLHSLSIVQRSPHFHDFLWSAPYNKFTSQQYCDNTSPLYKSRDIHTDTEAAEFVTLANSATWCRWTVRNMRDSPLWIVLVMTSLTLSYSTADSIIIKFPSDNSKPNSLQKSDTCLATKKRRLLSCAVHAIQAVIYEQKCDLEWPVPLL